MINNRQVQLFEFNKLPYHVINSTHEQREAMLPQDLVLSLKRFVEANNVRQPQYEDMCLSYAMIQYFLTVHTLNEPELMLTENIGIIQTPEADVVYILPTEDGGLTYRMGMPKGPEVTPEEIGITPQVHDFAMRYLVTECLYSYTTLAKYATA